MNFENNSAVKIFMLQTRKPRRNDWEEALEDGFSDNGHIVATETLMDNTGSSVNIENRIITFVTMLQSVTDSNHKDAATAGAFIEVDNDKDNATGQVT